MWHCGLSKVPTTHWQYVNGNVCIPIKLYLWALKFIFNIIFICHKILFFSCFSTISLCKTFLDHGLYKNIPVLFIPLHRTLGFGHSKQLITDSLFGYTVPNWERWLKETHCALWRKWKLTITIHLVSCSANYANTSWKELELYKVKRKKGAGLGFISRGGQRS